MQLPEHYQSIFPKIIRFSIAMSFVALLTGVLYQESSKKLAFQPGVPLEIQFQGNYALSMIHGHVFQLGVLLPTAMLGLLALALALGYSPISRRALTWGFGLYCPNATLALLLLIYKAYHTQILVRLGQLDLAVVHRALFGGIYPLRAALYGVSHTLFAVGLGILGVALWKSLARPKNSF